MKMKGARAWAAHVSLTPSSADGTEGRVGVARRGSRIGLHFRPLRRIDGVLENSS